MASNLIFIDTGALFAFIDKRDQAHGAIDNILKTHQEILLSTNYVVDELITLLRVRKIPIEKFHDFIDDLLNSAICRVDRITEEIDHEAWALMKKYKEHSFSFTDCTSFVMMKKYGIETACTTDRHFRIPGFQIIPE